MNRFFGLTFANQRESQEPVDACTVRVHCQHASQFPNCLVVPPSLEQNPPDANAGISKRIQLTRASGPGERLVRAPLAEQPVRKSKVRYGVVRFQLEGLLVFSLGITPLPSFLVYACQEDVRFGKAWIQFQCLPGGADYFWTYFTGGIADKNRAECVIYVCQADIGGRKRRVFPNGLLKVGNTLFEISSVGAVWKLSFEIVLIDFRRDMTRGDKPGAFLPGDGN